MSDKRLIDANHVSRVLREVEDHLLSKDNYIAEGTVRAIREHIENWPTVDATPVVRCKNCEHAEHLTFLCEGGVYCNMWQTAIDHPDGYCHHGRELPYVKIE